MTLEGKRWGKFAIGDLFHISPGKRLRKEDMTEGNTPFIGASDSNNGVTAFVSNTNTSEDSNILGVNYNGSVVESFYHPYRSIFSDDVKRFRLKVYEGNKHIYIFMKTVITQQKEKYTYGYKFNEERMKKQTIMLPVDENGQPDYEFMESFIRQREQRMLHDYIEYISAKIEQNKREVLSLSCVKWSSFFISDVAEILSGRDIYEDERVPGLTPYIGASAFNNGITHFINNTNETKEAECISVNRNGSVGYAFYHPYEALYSNDCRKIRPKVNNRYIAMFLAHQITVQRGKYNYGYKMGTERLKRQMIQLPVDESGQPDWEFMTQYMKSIEYELLLRYLKSRT